MCTMDQKQVLKQHNNQNTPNDASGFLEQITNYATEGAKLTLAAAATAAEFALPSPIIPMNEKLGLAGSFARNYDLIDKTAQALPEIVTSVKDITLGSTQTKK